MMFADEVAEKCYSFYSKLPKTGKPNTTKEWTHLAAIVKTDSKWRDIEIISLTTGSKCLGENSKSEHGDAVNDSHAEVLARRGFLRYLYFHIFKVCKNEVSEVIEHNPEDELYSIREGINIHLFISHTPCGDGSIFPKATPTTCVPEKRSFSESSTTKRLKLEGLDEPLYLETSNMEVSTADVYRTGAKCVQDGKQDPLLPGINYHITEVVRTKPGRGDRTLSVSCSDKIAKWNLLGLQGSLLSHFLKPVYLTSIIIGKCPFDESAMRRALYERIKLSSGLPPGYRHQQPQILQSSLNFEHGLGTAVQEEGKPAPAAIVWINIPNCLADVLIKGKRQGFTAKTRDSKKARSIICKKELFNQFRDIIMNLPSCFNTTNLKDLKTYDEFKKAAKNHQILQQSLFDCLSHWPVKSPQYQQFIWDT